MYGDKPHLLVVDRNPNVREFLRREFARLGFEVRTARNENEALRSAGSDRPDAIVLDPDAPREGRAPLYESLHRGHPDVPIVVHLLSASCRPDAGDYPGAAAVVEKDGSVEPLARAVLRSLREA